MVAGQLHGAAGDLELAPAAVPGNLFDHVAAIVAGGEIAAGIDSSGIGAQLGFDQADGFENLGEVEPRKNSQAAEGVGGGDTLRRFQGVLDRDNLGQRTFETILNPALHWGERVLLILKLLGQGNRKVWLERIRFGFQAGQHRTREGIAAGSGRSSGQSIRPQVGFLAQLLRAADARGDSGQGFD